MLTFWCLLIRHCRPIRYGTGDPHAIFIYWLQLQHSKLPYNYNLYISDAQENPTSIENIFFGGTILNEEASSGIFNLTYHWVIFWFKWCKGNPPDAVWETCIWTLCFLLPQSHDIICSNFQDTLLKDSACCHYQPSLHQQHLAHQYDSTNTLSCSDLMETSSWME